MARRAAQSQPDTKDTPDEVSGSLLLFVSVCLAKAEHASAPRPSARPDNPTFSCQSVLDEDLLLGNVCFP